jgi:uncharacterized protein DUF3761
MMRKRILISALAVLSLSALRSPLSAQATTVCKDGTTSATSGRGACSGHGGVDAKATDAAKKAAAKSAKKAEAASKAEAKTEAKAKAESKAESKKATTAAPTTSAAKTKAEPKPKSASVPAQASSNRGEDNDPKDAIAQCKDGMYSHAANRRGACSRHGGVGKWLKEP